MLLSRARDCVNKQMGVSRRIDRYFLACLFFLLILIRSNVCSAQNQDSDKVDRAVKYIAEKICAAAGDHASVVLEVRNLSTLSAAEVGGVRRSLEGELRNRGARLAAALPADADVRVTLSENLLDYLWVAEIHHGDAQQTAMITVPRARQGAQPNPAPALTLQKQLVWQQSGPMLDFVQPPAAPDGMPRLVVLEPERIALYSFVQSGWQFQEAAAISHQHFWPRDLRGRLNLREDSFDAELPGVSCQGIVRRNLSIQCEETNADDEWPLDAGGEERGSAPYSRTRNYFTGLVTAYGRGEEKLPPFFSAAVMKSPEATRWILTGLDGFARLYEKSVVPPVVFSGWGSEIVAVGSGCGTGWQVLVTRPGDWTQLDSLTAYEIEDGLALAVSQPLELTGPVTALWPTTDGKGANAVVHNLKTGQYETYSISITCSR